jgi:hypothetical protein
VRKDTLRELRLDIRNDTAQGEGERESLRDFERLEVLKVDGTALETLRRAWRGRYRLAKVDSFLSAFFPPSIREVTFWRLDGQEMEAAMLRLAKVVAVGRYPNLKSEVLAPSEKSGRQGYYDEWVNAGNWNGEKVGLSTDARQGPGSRSHFRRTTRPRRVHQISHKFILFRSPGGEELQCHETDSTHYLLACWAISFMSMIVVLAYDLD